MQRLVGSAMLLLLCSSSQLNVPLLLLCVYVCCCKRGRGTLCPVPTFVVQHLAVDACYTVLKTQGHALMSSLINKLC